MGIWKPDYFIKTLLFKLVVNSIENSAQYCNGIISIEYLLVIQLLPNLPCMLAGLHFITNDLVQLLRRELRKWDPTLALWEFIAMLGISMTSIWIDQYVECNQFYSLNCNLV